MANPGFHDVMFPAAAVVGAVGAVERKTDIVGLASGAEVRRSRWSRSRRTWSIGTGALDADGVALLLQFFEEREGRRFSFRFRDPLDFSSNAGRGVPGPTDQTLGHGDGSNDLFPLRKAYGQSVRQVSLPEAASIRVAIDGAEQFAGWALEDASIRFTSPPSSGATVTAGFLFDVPVRFGDDKMSVKLGASGGSLPSIDLIEVLDQ